MGLRIGLDLDGVVFDYVDNTREIAKAMWPERSADFDRPSTTWNYFSEDWGLTLDDFKYLNKWGMEQGLLFRGPVEPGWVETLDTLIEQGHTIHIVTHRSIPGVVSVTDEWLREHKIPYSSITFVSDTGDKSYTDLDVLIDDKVENILAWEATGRAAILYQRPWNRHYKGYAYQVVTPPGVIGAIDDIDHGLNEREPLSSKWAPAIEASRADFGEVRVVNATTGGEKGSKLARYDLIPVDPLRQVAEHFGKGAAKYADRNWERGYDWSLSYAALQRHANAFWGGETFDAETGSHHMAAVVFHAMALMQFTDQHEVLDDRPQRASVIREPHA